MLPDLLALRRVLRGLGLVMIGAGIGTLVLIGVLHLQGCAGAQTVARDASNAIADVANAAGEVVLDRYCERQLAALDLTGHRAGTHCVADGDATHDVTPAELAALARVRAAWQPLLRAHAALRHAHDALRAALDATDAATRAQVPALIADVVRAYDAVAAAAGVLGVTLPRLPGADGGAS